MARPKKQISDLPSDWVKTVISLSELGASEVEIRVALGHISDDLWYRLKNEDVEFSRTVSRAKLIAQVWWERKARENLENTKFNTRLWQLNMMNRYNWLKEESLNQVKCYKCIIEENRKKYDL